MHRTRKQRVARARKRERKLGSRRESMGGSGSGDRGRPVLTRDIEPSQVDILVTHHAARRVQDRAEAIGRIEADQLLREVVLTGRRSDRDATLRSELDPWIRHCQWVHGGREVTLFYLSPVGCLVVRGRDQRDSLVVLTAFRVIEGNVNTDWDGRNQEAIDNSLRSRREHDSGH